MDAEIATGLCVKRAMFRIRATILGPLRALLEWRDLRATPVVRMCGLGVHCADEDAGVVVDRDAILASIRDALNLIGKWEPRHLRHLQLGAHPVLVQVASSSGYLSRSRTILLELDLVSQHPAETIASVLVHELTHGRIERRGIRAFPHLIVRIELRCLREQISFLEKVPGADDIANHYRTLANDQWWTPQRRRQARLEYYGRLGTPQWALKTYAFLLRWRSPHV